MLSRKAVYYPKIVYAETTTAFGALESSCPDLYDKPISSRPNLCIVKLDALASLREIWGNNILQARPFLYELVSGNCSNARMYELIQSLYQKYSAFANYVTEVILFGDTNVPEVTRLFAPVRSMIDSYAMSSINMGKACGGKFLLRTHDYVYLAYEGDVHDLYKDVAGVTFINGL